LLTLTKLTIIIAINCFVIINNFCNHFNKALKEIIQFCRALIWMASYWFLLLCRTLGFCFFVQMSTFFRLLSLYCRTIYFWPSNQRKKRLSFLLCVFFKNLFSILLKNVMGYFKIASHLKSHAKWLSCLIRFDLCMSFLNCI